MKTFRSAYFLAVVVGLLCVSAPSHASDHQQARPPASQPPSQAAAGARTDRRPSLLDDFNDLTYTEQQKTEIRRIHEQSLSRLSIVAKDPKLDETTRAAMLQGYERIEYNEVFRILTPEQQAEIRKKIAARRQEENQHFRFNDEDYGHTAGLQLKAGSKRHQHIVGFEHPESGKTRFALVALDLPAGVIGESDKSD